MQPRKGLGRDNRFNPTAQPVAGDSKTETVAAPEPAVVKQSRAKPKAKSKADG